jgi:hypothetical protein
MEIATNSYNMDNNRYTDTDATDHLTGELQKLSVHDKVQWHILDSHY